ncbi:MAG: hypothetical protein A3H98_13700 [Bacteroidetes bacterium RIFCSPLOWO2_02_FULL_36_8]|nr:MAG: hypothetical protein A3H98_13700 [Bacteroidetes bacterium RIFCSPLOWO2_02_FULL_36_8]OFY70874.1 MAG: hypothetical protein A3G23_12195 [Bacteroidetes bacterium RIFCSPLOWO2_12_FULL_37_12]
MKIQIKVLLFFTLFLLTKCGGSEQKNTTLIYYNLTGLLNSQIEILKNTPVQLEKTVYMNHKSDKVVEKNPDWKKILASFSESDINKTAWIGFFRIDITESTEQLSSKNIAYKLLPEVTNIPVKKMEIYNYNHSVPDSINIYSEEKNLLFYSRKNLHIHFSDSTITFIGVDCLQKIKWMDTVNYGFRGNVR